MNKVTDDIFMALEKYKSDIKYLHHTIKDKDLTPDQILEREDVLTNKAKAEITALIQQRVVAGRIDEIEWAFGGSSEEEVSNSYWFERLKTLKKQLAELSGKQ